MSFWSSFASVLGLPRKAAAVALLDAGAPSDVTKALVAQPTKALGTGGTAVYGGIPDTHELARDMQGLERWATFNDLKHNVDVVSTGLRRVLTLVKGTTWRVQPAEIDGVVSPQAEQIAADIERILLAPRALARPFSKVVARQFLAVYDGAAVSEWIAKKRPDGLVGFADIQPRPIHTIERWDVLPDGTLRGVWQRSPWNGQEIYLPRGKIVYTVDSDLSDSPDGTGLLRHVAETARQLKHLEKIEGWQLETDLGGTPVARLPLGELETLAADGDISPAVVAAKVKGARDFITNRFANPGRGLVLPSDLYVNTDKTLTSTAKYDLEILPSQVSGFAALAASIDRKTRQIAWILGVEGILLGGDGRGTNALAKDKTAAMVQLITSGLDDVAESLDESVVTPLMLLNGWPLELQPKLVPAAVQLSDVEQICDALESLAAAALSPDDPVVNEVRALVGVSPIPQEQIDALVEDAQIRRRTPAPLPDDPEDDVEIDVDDLDTD